MSKCNSSFRAFLVFLVFVTLATPVRSLDLVQFVSFSWPQSDGFELVDDNNTSSIVITTLDVPVTQNFDTLATSGTANAWADDTTLTGWYSQFQLLAASPTTYRASTGTDTTGAIYSLGVAGTNPLTERAFGSVASGTPGNIFYAVKLTNNTGSTIGSIDVSFMGEQWRAAGCTPTPCTPASHKLDFQYQIANAGVITDANTPSTGWTDVNSLDFTTPSPGTSTASALDGNAAANRAAKAGTLTVAVNNGQEIWLRWMDINDANNDHGLAIDDVSLTPHGPGPEIDVSPTSIAFGNQQVGTTSAGMTVTISNTGTADLHIGNVITGSSVYSIVNSPAGTTITPGNNAQFSVTFSPASAGVHNSNLVISSDDADESSLNIPLSGTGVSDPEIGVSPTSIAFGNQAVGTTSTGMTVTISNTGTGDLHIDNVVTGNAVYSIVNSPAGTTIAPGNNAQFDVTFSPVAPATYNSSLTIFSDDADEGSINVSLSGTGVSDPEIGVTPTSLAFGNQTVGTTSAPRTVTISNTGTGDLHIESVITGNSAFSIVNSPAGTTITPGNNAQFDVTFSPASAAAYNTNLTISSDDADEPAVQVALSGTGTGAVIMVSPSINFGDQAVGTTSAGHTVTIWNNGNANLTVATPSISGPNASDFTRAGSFPQIIEPGESYEFDVFFTPSAAGPRSASFTISSNDPSNPNVVRSLSGTGVLPLVVDNTGDNAALSLCSSAPDDCSLRGAIENANTNSNPNIITFLSPLFDTPQTITLTSHLQITQPLTIHGPGADKLTISGNHVTRIFTMATGVSLSLEHLKMYAGVSGLGGAIFNFLGTLNIYRCTISNSFAIGVIEPFGLGGAIYSNGGTLSITNSTLSGNFADRNGGAIHTGDDDSGGGTIQITNSTFSGNGAVAAGGAIYNNQTSRLMLVAHSTIAFNTAQVGGGIVGFGEIGSSIIAASSDNRPDVAGEFFSLGYNLVGHAGMAIGFSRPTDQVGPVPPLSPEGGSTPLDPGLEALGNYGGPTQTHALTVQPISPAIDKGLSGGQTTDQRGFGRTFDNLAIPNAAGGDGTDIGAFERLAPTAAAVSVSGRVLTASGQGIRNARVMLYGGNIPEPITVQTSSFGYYSFDGLQPGLTYLITVETPRHVLAVPSRVLTITDDVTGFDFVAEPLE